MQISSSNSQNWAQKSATAKSDRSSWDQLVWVIYTAYEEIYAQEYGSDDKIVFSFRVAPRSGGGGGGGCFKSLPYRRAISKSRCKKRLIRHKFRHTQRRVFTHPQRHSAQFGTKVPFKGEKTLCRVGPESGSKFEKNGSATPPLYRRPTVLKEEMLWISVWKNVHLPMFFYVSCRCR